MGELRDRIRSAWQGRISGCQLGRPVEVLSMSQGHEGLTDYLQRAGALPLRDYVPVIEGTLPARFAPASGRGRLTRSEPDETCRLAAPRQKIQREPVEPDEAHADGRGRRRPFRGHSPAGRERSPFRA